MVDDVQLSPDERAWRFPGGRIESSDRSLAHAWCRELHEEVNITAEVESTSYVTNYTNRYGRLVHVGLVTLSVDCLSHMRQKGPDRPACLTYEEVIAARYRGVSIHVPSQEILYSIRGIAPLLAA